jgi:hypothetical protein
MLKSAKARACSYPYNLGLGSRLNRMTPGMAAQFWVDMGSYMITYKTKMRGSKVKDLYL